MPDEQVYRQIVMVVHGPEIFDTGDLAWLLKRVRPGRTVVAGVMARTAAEESGLHVEYDRRPPSRIIRDLSGPVVLANRGRTPASGRIFGSIVASRLHGSGLVQIECSDRTVIVWDSGDQSLARHISHLTGFAVLYQSSQLPVVKGGRLVRGCVPGEAVYVNGIVIGRATDETVVLRCAGQGIEAVSGLEPKPHGLEKIAGRGPVDIGNAWCKSGPIRSAAPRAGDRADVTGQVVVIDHCGHEIYRRIGDNCCGVLAIGDDTTSVCGHICAHRGIPVLGIVDGDKDAIVPDAFAPGSVVLLVQDGRDDDLGAEVIRMAESGPVNWGDWVESVLYALGARVRAVVDLRGRPDDAVR